jgi:hypothetical protein
MFKWEETNFLARSFTRERMLWKSLHIVIKMQGFSDFLKFVFKSLILYIRFTFIKYHDVAVVLCEFSNLIISTKAMSPYNFLFWEDFNLPFVLWIMTISFYYFILINVMVLIMINFSFTFWQLKDRSMVMQFTCICIYCNRTNFGYKYCSVNV